MPCFGSASVLGVPEVTSSPRGCLAQLVCQQRAPTLPHLAVMHFFELLVPTRQPEAGPAAWEVDTGCRAYDEAQK